MAELKTQRTADSVADFIDSVGDAAQRQDCHQVAAIMREVTGAEPQMWGSSIIGFGSYRYKYASGRTGDWMLTGFAPRKQNLVLYIIAGFTQYEELLAKLGRHKIGKSCLYIKKLADLDQTVLRTLIAQSVAHVQAANQVKE